MFADPALLRGRLKTLAATTPFRAAIAIALVCGHLVAFSAMGHRKLGLPFNSAPGIAPYFSDIKAMAVAGYPRQPHYWSRLIVSRWDAQIYIGFAVRGLSACPHKSRRGRPGESLYLHCGLGWLPAYGQAGGLISDATGVAPDIVLFGISLIAALIMNLLWTSRVFVERLGLGTAYAVLFAFNIYPSAFYMVAPYTEATTFALVFGGFICLSRDRWALAGLLIGASTALRMSAIAFGLALCCAAAYAAWTRRKEGQEKWWRPLVAIPLSGWGQVVTLVVFHFVVGTWKAYLRARAIFGDNREWGRLIDPQFYLRGFTAQHMDSVMLVGGLFIIALTARELMKRFRRDEFIFLAVASALAFVMSIPAMHEYWGLNRYLLGCPLLFLGTGMLARKHTAAFVLWCLVCAAIYWHVELCSYVAQGNPNICPCLGRVEFTMPF